MTREEAIQDLKDILEEATSGKDAVCYVTSEDAEAINMAIEALSAEAEEYEDYEHATLVDIKAPLRASAEAVEVVRCNVDHDRDWIIGCIEHDGFIHTHRFDKANQIIHDALSAEAVQGWRTGKPTESGKYMVTLDAWGHRYIDIMHYGKPVLPSHKVKGMCWYRTDDEWGDVVYEDEDVLAWMPLPEPYREDGEA